ncbi:MAG: hypothetical protein JXQ87_13855 [Bacteroidia bacterium]
MKNHYKLWLIFCISGLILLSAGLSLFGEALAIKLDETDTRSWFWWGTGALVVFNTGVSFFGKGVIHKVYHERNQKK